MQTTFVSDQALPIPGAPGSIAGWLATELAAILHIDPPHPDDDFFDAGGDSMSALALLAAIEQRYGHAPPLTAIYDAPTMASLAALIIDMNNTPPPSSFLRLIKRPSFVQAPKSAVVLIHGIGGHVFDLLRLGSLIETPHAVSAIRASGLADGETPFDRLETMADAYAALITATFPGLAIHLIGYSFGGMVAIEVARRLRISDNVPASVVLLDSYPHPRHWPHRERVDVRLRRVRHQIGVLRAAAWPDRIAYCRKRFGLDEGAAIAATSRQQWLAAPAGATPDIRAVFDATSIAIDHYQPTVFDDPVTFMAPERPSVFLPTRPRAVWRALLPQLDVQTVPGDHVSMMDDHAPALATLLSRVVERADRARP